MVLKEEVVCPRTVLRYPLFLSTVEAIILRGG